jgi:small conductance mechanosensitive channel
VALTLVVCDPLSAQEKQRAAPAAAVDIVALSDPKMPTREFGLRIIHLTRAELAELAKSWLKISQQQVKQLSSINISRPSAQGLDRQRLEADLKQSLQRRRQLFRKFDRILEEWEAKNAKPDEVADYRKYVSAVVRNELKGTDAETLLKLIKVWLTHPDGGIKIGLLLLSLMTSLLLAVVFALLLGGIVGRFISNTRQVSSLLRDFLSKVAFWLILVVSIMVVLSMHGINLTPLLAAFGGASFVIAFATQSTLSNLASGLLLMVTRPFDVGDDVDVAGVSGRVQTMSIVSTVIRSSDNQTIVVPNTKIWGSVIMNRDTNDIRP